MAIILILTTENGQTIELPITGKCVVGRSSSCDFSVSDKQMSGKHGQFEIGSNGELIYSDLGSTNGSFINNNQITKVQFRTSEVLRLGSTNITIDEKRLSAKERISVGRGIADNSERTIILPAATKSIVRDQEPPKQVAPKPAVPKLTDVESRQRKTIILNKDLKKKSTPNQMTVEDKNLIEQEESSGKTKFLKLDILKKKKK